MKTASLISTMLMSSLLLAGKNAWSDDGELVRKSMSKASGNPVLNPVPEAEHAFIDTMKFYVPAQASSGDVTLIDYVNADGALVESRGYAKPLIGVYINGPVVGIEGTGFAGHGKRDAYAAVSLDDGTTWKATNLSESSDSSSFEVSIPIPDPGSSSGDAVIEVDADSPAISEAEYETKGGRGRSENSRGRIRNELEVEGEDLLEDQLVTVRNAVTQVVLGETRVDDDGEWELELKNIEAVPCYVQASVDDTWGPAFAVEDAPEDCVGEPVETITQYPGDVINIFQATAGSYTIAAWPSRYCSSGKPNYSLETSSSERRLAIANELGINLDVPAPANLYLVDMYGVGGQQQSVDYSEDRFAQNQPVGEVPYACLWAARGVLAQGDDPRTETVEASYMRWFKAERLTSGRRDVNRIETKCVAGAGCAITWQEDPEGLRPGQGEGPGEGWSGAIANRQTDVWYSYISWSSFDLVEDSTDVTDILSFDEYLASAVVTKPQVGIPMAMPMRVTDNARCNVTNPQPYCNGSAISANHPDVLNPLGYGLKDMCADTVAIATGQQGTLSDICVTEDGLPLVGNIAATRPRLGLFGYDADGVDGIIDSAWVVFEAEESKGLGAFGFTDTTETGVPCDPDVDETCVAFDEGKNLWYYSFGMSLTDQAANSPDGLVVNLAGHGNMLNQPEVNWQTGELYTPRNTADLWDFGSYNFDIYNTEIARRGSLLAQPISKFGPSGLAALPAWKQGIMNQGGPADVMVRRIIAPTSFNPSRDNPYVFRNMDCALTGASAFYPDGVCLEPAINLSGYIPDNCTDSQLGGEVLCPQMTFDTSTFGISNTNPILQGSMVTPNTTKVLSWHQCPAEFTTVSGETLNCADDTRTDDSTLADQSWYNPLDVSKGHRGYLDGDFVMMLYAWSPNWRTNAVGNDRYELYVRRSFNGGASWTNLPPNYTASNGQAYSGAGNVSCETFRSIETGGGDIVEPRVCNSYAAGANEQARNVTQLKSMRFTTLDPRFAATAASITADPFGNGIPDPAGEDLRDPSRYFIVYETGDNTTTAEGEPEPDDLFYSRAVQFGDNYQVWAEETDLAVCYPSDPHGDVTVAAELIGSGFCNEFDQLDQGSPGLQASEASIEANPSGGFMYGVWAQWLHDEATDELIESDAMARRTWWIDDFIPANAWITGQGTGDGIPAN